MTWWIWSVIGFVLLGGEILTSGFFLLFFGFGAILVSCLVAANIVNDIAWQWIIFAFFSLLLMFLLRKRLHTGLFLANRKEQVSSDFDTLVGTEGRCSSLIPIGGRGRVEIRGSTFDAVNTRTTDIHQGEYVKVHKVDGITLFVE